PESGVIRTEGCAAGCLCEVDISGVQNSMGVSRHSGQDSDETGAQCHAGRHGLERPAYAEIGALSRENSLMNTATPSPVLAWPNGHRVAVVVSVLLETWSEGKSPSYFPRTTPLPPGSKDIAGINWSQFGGNEGVWRLSRNLKDLGIPATMFCNGRSAE